MDKFRIMFLRDKANQPVGCVAITLNKTSTKAKFNLTTLNPVDDFDRKLARQLAIGRAVEDPMVVTLPKDASIHDVSAAVMKSIGESKTIPDRSRKAARRWLRSHSGKKSE